MTTKSLLAFALATSALLAVPTTASAESKTDLARKSIATAQAKIDAANIVGAAGDAPRLHAAAVQTLNDAREELRLKRKSDAIRTATRASELADQALTASQRDRKMQEQATTDAALQQASDANARAAAAQAAAAAAQADAAAARAAPPVVIQAPAPVVPTSTTVTTTQTDRVATPAAKPVVKKKVVRRSTARPAARSTQTTTTVTTGQ